MAGPVLCRRLKEGSGLLQSCITQQVRSITSPLDYEWSAVLSASNFHEILVGRASRLRPADKLSVVDRTAQCSASVSALGWAGLGWLLCSSDQHQHLGQPESTRVIHVQVFFRGPLELLGKPSPFCNTYFLLLDLDLHISFFQEVSTAVTGGSSCLSIGRAVICISL